MKRQIYSIELARRNQRNSRENVLIQNLQRKGTQTNEKLGFGITGVLGFYKETKLIDSIANEIYQIALHNTCTGVQQ